MTFHDNRGIDLGEFFSSYHEIGRIGPGIRVAKLEEGLTPETPYSNHCSLAKLKGNKEMGCIVKMLEKVYVDPQTAEEVVAIRDLSLEIHSGEFVSVVGPSGCGKTTFLHMVGGLRSITGGSIYADSKEVTKPGPDRCVVFQDYALFPWKTALENVAFGLKIKGIPKKERSEISRYYLKMVKLEGFEAKYPRELSGGMQQRVGIARALAIKPSILLMDEPFASVDALTRANLQELLTRVWEKERRTVIFVTHSVEEAIFLADRVIVFSSRPARCRKIFEVKMSRPRVWSHLRSDPSFTDLRAEILRLIENENRERKVNR